MRHSIIFFLYLFLQFNVNATDEIPAIICSLTDDFDSWSVEVEGQKAAFFDNDTLSYAVLKSVKSNQKLDIVYESEDRDDPFIIAITMNLELNEIVTASIGLDYDGSWKKFSLDCELDDYFMFLE